MSFYKVPKDTKLDITEHEIFNKGTFKYGERVELEIANESDLGFNAIVNGTHVGVLYDSEIFVDLKVGQKIPGYIRLIREDDKIDLVIDKPGYGKIDKIARDILKQLKEKGGQLPYNDKSSPEVIYDTFGISKKNFKKAVSALYKRRLISIEENGISLNDEENPPSPPSA